MRRTLSQSVQTLRNHTQKPRSTFDSRGRFTERWRTTSCWRRARFSRASERRVLKAEMSERRSDQIMAKYRRPLVRKIKIDAGWTSKWKGHATFRRLVTYYVLVVIELSSRKVHVAGITPGPDSAFNDAGRSQPYRSGRRLSSRQAIPHPGPRQEVHSGVPGLDRGRGH